MTSKRKNPAGGKTAGLGKCDCVAAINTRETMPALTEIQAKFLRDRFGLEPERAAIIASLAWGGARG